MSILLLAAFGLPFLLPMLAMGQDADAGLPACCRRNGKHHCNMDMESRRHLVSHEPEFKALTEKCPCAAFSGSLTQSNPLSGPIVVDVIAANLVTHARGVAQSEAQGRISRDRSHGKRGPPSLTSL